MICVIVVLLLFGVIIVTSLVIFTTTSDVLEHKWRASLKTILFLYDFDF